MREPLESAGIAGREACFGLGVAECGAVAGIGGGAFSARRGKGVVFVSTFLSAGERVLFSLLAANGGRMVVVKERGLGWVYRPDIHEAPLLGEGRLAVLGLGGERSGGPTARHQEVTREGSLLLNGKIAAMAEASGGLPFALGRKGWRAHDGVAS